MAVVKNKYVFSGRDIYSLNNGLIRLTPSHPIYVMKPDGTKCWASLSPPSSTEYGSGIYKLEIGDKIYSVNGWIRLDSIEKKGTNVDVYTLELEGGDNFLANGILAKSFEPKHTLYERYIQLKVTYKTYDAEPPSTTITDIENLPTVYYSPDEITISWSGEDDVSDPEDLVYKYRLDPVETEWQPVGGVTTNTSVTYRASDFGGEFPRGNYTFRVRARDESGKWEVDENGGNTYRFSVIPANDTLSSININEGENATIVLPKNLDNDFILMEFYDGNRLFGRAWVMDFTILKYTLETSSGTYGVSFENSAIVMISPGGNYIKEPPYITVQDGKIYMHFIQFNTPSGFGISGEGASIAVSSRVTDSAIREQDNIYYLRIYVAGEHQTAWEEYLDKMYDFDMERGSLTYTGSYPVSLTLVHTIIECQQKG
ncbi:MAG TPA: hypothetical protein ENG74_03050 [Thermoplasmatales archaeon]|nr:hypothetical protein [Thermoplasmatales archaeon]